MCVCVSVGFFYSVHVMYNLVHLFRWIVYLHASYTHTHTCETEIVSSSEETSSTVLPRLSVPRLSETSIIRTQFQTWICLKSMVFSLKSQTLRQSRVHVFVCHTYMFNVGTQWYVILYSVMCKGIQMRPSYIFLCYNSMYIARKVSFGLLEQFRLSEQPIKPLCPKVFG